ncbi:hypothetical protein FOA52_006279 [Chlamydomonas sp. UWO 241]|nr:hypothetical protein FOA52_006279 [Chlamydomonas sp. UWO 241]
MAEPVGTSGEEGWELEQLHTRTAHAHDGPHTHGHGGGEGGHPCDVGRVLAHFDVDCFYAQAEELRNPALAGLPLGVTQKYLVVTCNYAARAQGVTKLMGIQQAQAKCPSLVLVSGEDLTPYRAASQQILSVLQRYGPAEKLGLDEVWVDITTQASSRLAASPLGSLAAAGWIGHVHMAGGAPLVSASATRPMDLRVQSGVIGVMV